MSSENPRSADGTYQKPAKTDSNLSGVVAGKQDWRSGSIHEAGYYFAILPSIYFTAWAMVCIFSASSSGILISKVCSNSMTNSA